jgi:tRNA dimethylallyltransferase
MRKSMIIIFGPTGVGKTDFAELLAARTNAEIVNADLGQFYTPLSIGTAKPDWQNSPIAQHLFDIIKEPRIITATEYRDQLMQILDEIWDRKNIPIIVGGSGFYLQSLFFPPVSTAYRQTQKNYYGPENERWNLLYLVDPDRALKIHHNDLYRINRALDIFYSTGKKPSEQEPHYQPPGSFYFVYLNRNRQDLYERINKRTRLMMKAGWLEEVGRLQKTDWEPFLKKKKLIGYDDILKYLEGTKTKPEYDELIDHIALKTRKYAKRQITFGNRLYANLEKTLLESLDTRSSCMQVNLTSGKLELYINQLLLQIESTSVQ